MIYIYIMNHHDVFYPHHSTKRTSYYDRYLLDAHCHGMPLVYSDSIVWSNSISQSTRVTNYRMFLSEVRQGRLQASWNEGGVIVKISTGPSDN